MKKKTFIKGILLVLFCFISISMYGVIPAQERSALIALYNSTGGDGWNNNSGWKTPPLHTDGFAAPGTEGNWYGIQIREDHVTAIYLSRNNLYGPIPSEFGKLGNLIMLRMSDNSLTGSIPSSFGNLGSLQTIDLGYNRLSGSIPLEMGNLHKLINLGIGYNQLSGEIPSSLGNLANLYYLWLSNNPLSGSIPSSLGNLRNLFSLRLNGTHITGSIPPELGNLDNLRFLTLTNNRLSGSIPPVLGNLKNLNTLELQENQLSGNIPSSLGNLAVHTLKLDHNYLSGEIPPGISNLNRDITLDIGYNCLQSSNSALRVWLDSHDPDWEAHQNHCGVDSAPFIILNRTQLNYCALAASTVTVGDSQELWITNEGGGVLNWEANADVSWLSCAPASGTGNGTVVISINPTGLAEGTYTGNITISDDNAKNSPRTVSVALKVKPESQQTPPFGDFSTPVDGSTVSGSIPVTGWVLDDVTVQDVKIYHGEDSAMVYVGTAVFVEGARPDIEAAYPDYPNNYKSGWGYMLLTNYLPNGGNGEYKLHAVATDINGNSVDLGVKTITVDNANAVKPFGNIDTPVPGGVVSGEYFVNYGWVLTPTPNYIPISGSTIDVWIDGVLCGRPIYNNYREDIASRFPGYANSNGAVGYFYLDATAYENGIHTIAWTAFDSAGNSEGIGSRYFIVQNSGVGGQGASVSGIREKRRGEPPCSPVFDPCSPGIDSCSPGIDRFGGVGIIKGYREDAAAAAASQTVYPDKNGIIAVEIKELERLEIQFSPGVMSVSPLPIGSTLDMDGGKFYWQPGPGFIGQYRFVFIEKEETGPVSRKEVVVTIVPKFSDKV